ncbi:ommochrome-binding protein-like [Ostrinia nubilalis]|uniref:ommochrome-binding protein-like n=1 Tax=Ostrinia nubilalis TaxID=29057 RepID=UPI0030822EC0
MAHSPNQLAVDKSTNTLYFSFDFGQGEYMPAVVNIDHKKMTVLRGVKDAFAVAYDTESKEMYFGGSHGIYRYHPGQKQLRRLAMENLDIWWLFVKKRIYFIKFPSLNAYYYDNRTIKHVSQLSAKMVHQFVFDNDDNVFFINTTGLYGIKKDSDEAVLLRDYPRFLGMAMDNKGQIYVCSDDAIFVVSKMVQKVKRVVNIQGVLGLTFDRNNNIIYSDSHEIVRLLQVSNDNYYDTLNNLSLK